MEAEKPYLTFGDLTVGEVFICPRPGDKSAHYLFRKIGNGLDANNARNLHTSTLGCKPADTVVIRVKYAQQ